MAANKKTSNSKRSGHTARLDDPKLRAKYLKALEKGTRTYAASLVGLSRRGAQRYRKGHPEFRNLCLEAESKFKGSLEQMASNAALKGNWPAIKFLLERRWFNEWAQRNPESYTLKDLVRFAAQLGQAMAAALPPDQQVAARRIIDQQMEVFLLGGTGGK